jgi:branched-chain amino acid transport system ATP-binding protein
LASDALIFEGVDAYYGDSLVLRGVSFRLRDGAVLGLLGRNGAGKSTCMNVAVGLLPARHGSVQLYSETISGLAPEDISRRGVALVPQTRRIFKNLSVAENLLVAARRPAEIAHEVWTEATVYAAFPRLAERKKQLAGSLSGGEQQMLAIGRALMSNPRVLLMDEPSEGLAPQIVAEVMATVGRLKEQGLSIVLVEQNTKLVFDFADDIVILNTGRVVVTDSAEKLRTSGADLSEHLGVF